MIIKYETHLGIVLDIAVEAIEMLLMDLVLGTSQCIPCAGEFLLLLRGLLQP
jgi:hypothetical protein